MFVSKTFKTVKGVDDVSYQLMDEALLHPSTLSTACHHVIVIRYVVEIRNYQTGYRKS